MRWRMVNQVPSLEVNCRTLWPRSKNRSLLSSPFIQHHSFTRGGSLPKSNFSRPWPWLPVAHPIAPNGYQRGPDQFSRRSSTLMASRETAKTNRFTPRREEQRSFQELWKTRGPQKQRRYYLAWMVTDISTTPTVALMLLQYLSLLMVQLA